MVRTALRYLNNLAGEAGDDPELKWELANAYQKIGDVQGYRVRPNLGQSEAAMESHRKALAIAEELTSRGYDPKVQRLLAVAHHRVGYLIESAHRGSVEGIDHYRQSLELLEHLNRDAPSSYDVPALLLSVYGHHGDAELVARGGGAVVPPITWRPFE
jgi:hypothetical protein